MRPPLLLFPPLVPKRPIPLLPLTQSFSFSFSPLPTPQTLSASLILPHRAAPLFNLIADIPSYPLFLPYLLSARTTSMSQPDARYRKRWPRTADLRVGWGPYEEVFGSRVFCVPDRVVEAVVGTAACTIPKGDLEHYEKGEGEEEVDRGKKEDGVFQRLLTRWTLREFMFKPPPEGGQVEGGESGCEGESKRASTLLPERSTNSPPQPRTEVSLVIEAQFANPVYAALSQAAAPRVAGKMVAAFERRAREVLGDSGGTV